MKILYVGDVMAEPGMQAVEKILPGLIASEGVDFVVEETNRRERPPA
jgi:calcineurin-like phosphoesterase